MSNTTVRFFVSPAVRSCSDKDGTTLLHIAENRIYGLVGVGSVIWEELVRSKCGLAQTEIVHELESEFSLVPRDRLEQDVGRLLDGFEQKNLIERSITLPGIRDCLTNCIDDAVFVLINATIRLFLVLRMKVFAAVFAFAMVELVLRVLGFNHLYNLVRQWPTSEQNVGPEVTTQLWSEICRGITWYPRQVMCLQRSVVTTWLLRSSGLPAQMVIGCQRRPFLVHAWTEVNDLVVNDRQSVREVHEVIDRC